MGFTAAGINKDLVSTTQQAPLGFRLTVPTSDKGPQTWVYVKANGDIDKGAFVAQSTTDPYVVIEAGADTEAVKVYGVAQSAIATGSYAFVIARGYAPVILSTSATSPDAGDQIKSAANGVAAENPINAHADVAANLGYMLTAPVDVDPGAGTLFHGTGMVICGTGS